MFSVKFGDVTVSSSRLVFGSEVTTIGNQIDRSHMWLEMDRIQIFGTIWALLTVIVIVTSAAELDGIPRVYKCPILGTEQETLNISKTFKIRQYYDVNGTVSNNESGEFRLLESPGLYNCSGEEVTLNTTKDGVQFSPEGYLRWLNGDRMIYSSPEKYCIQK